MKTCAKTTLLAFTMVALVASPLVEAARMGKGRSLGMRRAAPMQFSQRQAAPPPAGVMTRPAAPSGQTQPRRGAGIGTAVAAGAAGAVAGYALGSMMNDGKAQETPTSAEADNSQQHTAPSADSWNQTQASTGTPWGLIIVLAALFVVGLIWFRRKIAPPGPVAVDSARQSMGMQQTAHFEAIPKIGSGMADYNGASVQTSMPGLARLTDGTETPYFLRQAKATFLHLQSLNTPENLEEVRKYMMPDLVESLRDDIASNSEVADFPTLDCQLLESTVENGYHIASVRFFGSVSEAVNAEPVPFAETWHYSKNSDTNNKWLVSGIQQD